VATRVNLAPNPALKNNATGWTGPSGWVRSTSVSGSLPRTTGFEGSTTGDVLCPRAAVSAGQSYYWAISVKANSDLHTEFYVNYYAALSGGSFVGNAGRGPSQLVILDSGEASRYVIGPFVTPAGAVSGNIKINDVDASCEITAYQVELASTYAGTYFDGDSTGATWDGTAGNSTSTIREIGSGSGSSTQQVQIAEAFTITATADGPVTTEPVTIQSFFSVDAGLPFAESLRLTESFLITSLEWDPVRGRNRISAFTFDLGVVTARVSRRPVTGGAWQLVRGGTVDVVGGFMSRRVDDYEFPSGVDLEYRIEGVTSASAGSVVAQVATVHRRSIADSAWLKFITQPALNRRLDFMGRTDIARPSRTAVFDVINRSDPVVVSDVHSSRRFTITVKAETQADTDALDYALSRGLPCYLQVPQTYNCPSIYAVVGDYQFEAPARKSQRNVFTIPLTEVAAPPPSVVPPHATWQSLLNQYAAWDDVIAAASKWLDIAD
jgi:hypothetical protein